MSATGIIDHVVRPHVAQTEEKYFESAPSMGAQTYIPGQWPSGVNRIVSNILALFEARNMSEHCAPMPVLSKHVVWDAPPFLLSRKGSVRVSSYLFKWIASQKFFPSLVQVRRVGLNSHLVEVSGTLMVYPRRTFLLPATLLLPKEVPIRSTISIGVDGDLDSGLVELVAVKWHNLPSLPNFMRAGNGLAFGTVPHLLEPIWSYLPEFVGDDFYRRKREATFNARHPHSGMPALDAAKDVVKDTAGGAMDYGVDTVHNLWDGTSYLYNNILEALGFSLGRARAYTATAADLAANVAGTAYNTAANVAGTAYSTATNVAGAAVNTAANVAGTAANVAAGTAGMAYDAAATTATRAADVAAQAAGAAAGTARVAAGAATDTARMAASTAADTASRAYDTTASTARTAYETGKETSARAYDTAADTANRTYYAAADKANRAYETGRETADTAAKAGRDTVEAGRQQLETGAEDFKRGYEMGKNKPVTVPGATTTTTYTTTTRAPGGVNAY